MLRQEGFILRNKKYYILTTKSMETNLQRTKCEIYTRVMGYFRPVSHFNIGKKSEFYSRKYFKEETSMNSEFIKNYSQKC